MKRLPLVITVLTALAALAFVGYQPPHATALEASGVAVAYAGIDVLDPLHR